jgi:hypothetical protein
VASLLAGAYLEDGENTADFGIEAGVGIQAYARAELQSPLLDPLKSVPLIKEYVGKEWEFGIPIVGTPTADVSIDGFALPWTFDYVSFRSDIAGLLGVDPLTLDDEGIEHHLVSGIPISFHPDDLKVGVELGASARVYAETQLTAGIDVYFLEAGDTATSYTTGDYLADVFDDAIDLAQSMHVTSDTGTLGFNDDGLTMTTGSPVWITSLVETDDTVNLVGFDLDFTSELGAEGLLSIYWQDELVATIDERMADDGMNSYIFLLPDEFEAGFYSLAFRLDPYTEMESSVEWHCRP